MSDGGEDSPPPRPRRKIKKIILASSSSASESDDSGPATSTRKKRLRVLSDEDSESSGSSVVLGSRRKRTLPKLRDSDGDSDTSGWATDHSDAPGEAASNSVAAHSSKPASGFASDSSEGNSDKCSICLMRFTDQQVGTPQSCEHMFCLDCITEWSRNVNTCPVDRITFDFIVVRACAGGRVMCTQPVQVLEHVPSVEMLLVEDHTSCEICGNANSEDTMLLCDGCDLGFHMECLTPPLTMIPINQWLCPSCDNRFDVFDEQTSDADGVQSDVSSDGAGAAGAAPGRRAGAGAGPASAALPSTSRARPRAAPARRTHRTRRRKQRTRTRTVIVEYHLEGNGKVPVTRRVKRRVKKRKTRKRQPRTAARRTHVRESVRAKLAAQRAERAAAAAALAGGGALHALAARRARAGIAPLSLFGDAHDFDYFSEDEERAGPAGTAVAVRAAPAAYSAYRQARRKMVAVPSPPPAAAAPDILSAILESQTLLHSKRSVVSITATGDIDIKLEGRRSDPPPARSPSREAGARPDRVDVPQDAGGAARQAPYPGQARGGGGWGGGYRYPRDYGHRAPADNGYGAGPAPRPHHRGGPAPRRDDQDGFNGSDDRRPYRYPPDDEPPFDRNRRPGAHPGGRRSGGPAWRPPAPRPAAPSQPQRHSFGGFENPLDMRTARAPPPESARGDKPAPSYAPLPEPPAFPFAAALPDAEEDERSDSSLVIDTEKYDPTEPTNDDEDSGSPRAPPPPPPLAPPASLAAVETILAGLEPAAGVPAAVLDSAVRQVLRDHRALLEPPRADRSDDDEDGDCPNFSIYSATSVHIASDASAGALTGAASPRALPAPPAGPDGLEDLVQGDGDASPAAPELSPPPATSLSPPAAATTPPAGSPRAPALASPASSPPAPSPPPTPERNASAKKSEEYNEKVSKRCPITSNTRNPIKIKLNTPSLIRRQVSLYDEEDAEAAAETEAPPEAAEPAAAAPESAASEGDDDTPERDTAAAPRREPSEERDPSERDDSTPSAPASSPPPPGDEAGAPPAAADDLEKMTESISETEDERSYTPCLDEHRDEPERGIEGLDTEMISEDEGNGLFSEEERRAASPPAAAASPPAPPRPAPDDTKKKKRKESKKEGKERKGKSKRGEVAFKKSGKGGKERNYRARDATDEEKRRSPGESERARRRKEKRKDLERYDVRTLVSEKRRRTKDAFGRDVSPPPSPPARASASPRPFVSPRRARGSTSPRRARASVSPRRARVSISPPPRRARPSISPRRARPSISPRRTRLSPSPRRARASISPRRVRPSISPRRARPSVSPRRPRPSISPRRAHASPSPRRIRASPSPRRVRASPSPRRSRASPSPSPPAARRSASPRRRRRRSSSRGKRAEARRRRSGSRARKRRRSGSAGSPKPKAKKKKRARSERSARRKSPKRARARRGSEPRAAAPAAAPEPAWSPRPASPRTPPPQPAPPLVARKRRDRSKHRRVEPTGPSKEVFTSGDNILVSVSFKEQEKPESGLSRRERRRERRRRKRRAAVAEEALPKPVAIIDLERSPFRELTPSPKNVIVLSDDEHAADGPAPAAAAEPAGPKTPPEPGAAAAPAPAPAAPDEPRGPNTPPEPPDSPDAYDPYEPTASPPPAPAAAAAASPARVPITLEAAQKTNMSADEVLDRRPLSPIEKVMALLQSTRDAPPDPPPDAAPAPAAAEEAPAPAPAPRIVLPEPARAPPPKLFLAKPSPIKSDPIKPMQQATKISRLPLPHVRREAGGESPYSPGSSDFGDLFEPPPAARRDSFDALFDKPPRRKRTANAAKVPVKLNKKKGKTQVDVKIDDDSLKILDELPSSAVEMQVKSKFLKKLNRQERVVEEVKLVLKPHYNKKHVTKDEYKHILRRTVPKICHNKTGEINPTKIQALVEAYVKKFRKKHKLGLS